MIMAEPVEDRVKKARDNIIQFIEKIKTPGIVSIELEELVTDLRDFYSSVSLIRRKCFNQQGYYIVNISGGMRALGLATLIAFIQTGIQGVIEVELENFLYLVTLDPIIFRSSIISEDEKKILTVIAEKGSADYKILLEKTKIPRATLFRTLKNLREKGLIKVTKTDRTSMYELSEVGKAYV